MLKSTKRNQLKTNYSYKQTKHTYHIKNLHTIILSKLNNKNHYFINKICIFVKFYSIFKFILLESNELNFVLTKI